MSGRVPGSASFLFPGGMCVCAALAGCAAGVSGLYPGAFVASYQPANVLAPAGFSERKIGEMHFEVSAAGTEATPPARVEKIALARAAEIGAENRLKYFKVLSVAHNVTCTKKREVYKGTVPAAQRPTAVLDVIYAKAPPPGDTGFRPSEETFQALKAELDGEVIPPEAAASAAAEIKARCGT